MNNVVTITEEQKKEYQTIFEQYDKDKDEKISEKELRLILNDLNHNLSYEESKGMFNKVDLDKDGLINFNEFIAVIINFIDEDIKNGIIQNNKKKISTLKYLEENVISTLEEGMIELTRKHPSNPLEFLGNFLLEKSKEL